jgi:hypothetical protein
VLADVAPSLAPPQRRALEVALLLAEPGEAPPDQRAVALAALAAVRALAADGPLLLGIDDVQWLDPPSARVLQFVLRRLESEPVGTIAARRAGAEHADPLELPRLVGRFRSLEVGPLEADALDEIVHRQLGVRLTRASAAHLRESSGGNPFYALEIVRALRGRDAAPDEPLPVPESLRALVRDRLAALPADAGESLLVVAVAAHPTPDLVRAAGVRGLDAALEAGVVELDGVRLRFTHPLLASGVYADSTAEARRSAHLRVGTSSTIRRSARAISRWRPPARTRPSRQRSRRPRSARARAAHPTPPRACSTRRGG